MPQDDKRGIAPALLGNAEGSASDVGMLIYRLLACERVTKDCRDRKKIESGTRADSCSSDKRRRRPNNRSVAAVGVHLWRDLTPAPLPWGAQNRNTNESAGPVIQRIPGANTTVERLLALGILSAGRQRQPAIWLVLRRLVCRRLPGHHVAHEHHASLIGHIPPERCHILILPTRIAPCLTTWRSPLGVRA